MLMQFGLYAEALYVASAQAEWVVTVRGSPATKLASHTKAANSWDLG